jgi:hypothetical protein
MRRSARRARRWVIKQLDALEHREDASTPAGPKGSTADSRH